MGRPSSPALAEARLQAVLKLLPAIQVFTLVDALLLTWYFWDEAAPFMLGWSAAVAVHGAIWWSFARRERRPVELSPGRWRWLMVHAAGEGVLFSVMALVVFPQLAPEKAVVLGAFVTGLLAAGGLSKMSLRPAALVFIVTLTLGSAAAFGLSTLPSVWVAETLLGAFAFALAVLVSGMSTVFDARVEAEAELTRQKALVTDLLEDFGESSADGLWEADPLGNLTHVSTRVAALLERDPASLTGTPLFPPELWAGLVGRGVAFRNSEVAREGRWWSVTAKPRREGGRLVGWRGVVADVTEGRQRELEVLHLSRYDGLTGLLNRGAFRVLVDQQFSPSPLRCLVLIDLVNFKDVNEAQGHAFGDALLVAVAERLKTVPNHLIVARLDGDEFALQGPVPVSAEQSITNVGLMLERLIEPYEVLGQRYEAAFRVGVAFSHDAATPEQWLRCADLALRSAKTKGRNRVEAYEPAMMESFLDRNRLRADLLGACQRGELRLEYQPIVALAEGRVAGFEALTRWHHPTRGVISPAVFIPLAEEGETIVELGQWVLEQACQEALSWPDHVSLSVNVSGVQLRSGQLATMVTDTAARLGFDLARLVLEVTESALVKNDGALAQTFAVLKAQGVHWALDDFGTGYSALSYLQDFPFDKLKIDQSFVRPLAAEGSPALLGSILSLARTLGLRTTAEGVENEAQRRLLNQLGCEDGQGFLFSRPISALEISNLLAMAFPRGV